MSSSLTETNAWFTLSVLVIMVTANEGRRHQAYAESLGVDRYMQKPVPLGKLLDVAAELVDQELEDDGEE